MATEKRLIDANDYPCSKCGKYYCYENCKEFIDWLNNTVDAVEVVRCKDCVYYREDDLLCIGVGCVGDSHANWYPDDFCSYGERKDNG